MAVLAVIGGIDGRLRLGGQVTHDEFGEGTVTRITPKGRITVQFADMRTCRVCPLNQLKPVGGLGPVPKHEVEDCVLGWGTASALAGMPRRWLLRPGSWPASARPSPPAGFTLCSLERRDAAVQ